MMGDMMTTHHSLNIRNALNTLPILCAVCLLLTSLFGCNAQPKQFEDPVGVMTYSKNPLDRMDAARQAKLTRQNDPRYYTALNKMLWEWGHGDDERRFAIDELLAHDEKDFRNVLARRIVMIKNPQTIDYICDLAISHQWHEFTPALVRSYARMLTTGSSESRPELKALVALNPDTPIQQIVFDVFANADDTVRITEQIAAWNLLWQLTDREHISTMLANAPDTNPMVVDLKASLKDLHCLPLSREGYLRLAWLRDPQRIAYWASLKAVVAQLNPSQQQGLALRHLPVLLTLKPNDFAQTRDQLINKLSPLLDSPDIHLRGNNVNIPTGNAPQRFAQVVDELVWADLVTIDQLYAKIQSPEVIDTLFKQADKDLVDTGSEHGGVITIDGDGVQATRFAAMIRDHDYKYIPTDEMIQSLYTNLAHYHFHAQRHHSRHVAGPGTGDLRMVVKLETHCLVFTFIDQDTLNIDYYQPNGAMADLGIIRR